MSRGNVLAILYDLAVVIGAHSRLRPLLTHTLQRLLQHGGFPAGFVCLDVPAGNLPEWVGTRIYTAIGDYRLIEMIDGELVLPSSLLAGDSVRLFDEAELLNCLPAMDSEYRVWLRLPIHDPHELRTFGVVMLLARRMPRTRLPLTQIFRPIMVHLSRAVRQCQAQEKEAATLMSECDRLFEERNLMASVFESSHSGVMILDAQGRILEINPAFSRLCGYGADDVLGRLPSDFMFDKDDSAVFDALWGNLQRDGHWQGEICSRRKDGSICPQWLSLSPVMDGEGRVTHHVGIVLDMTEKKQAEARIHELAYHDPLTGLPNRRQFIAKLQEVVDVSEAAAQWGAVLMLDLDNFKVLNDTRGHAAGDLLLCEVARRLRRVLGDDAMMARPGGDEFLILLEALGREEVGATLSAATLAGRLRDALREAFLLQEQACHITASVGVALFRGDEHGADDLLKHADAAMYDAKGFSRDSCRFYRPGLQQALEARFELEEALREAVRLGGQFTLYYQPQVESGGHILSAEALLRWFRPGLEWVSPARFIPLAEETGLILPIGAWVLDTACHQLARWARMPTLCHLILAVNVSVKQFSQADFVEQVSRVMARHGVVPSRLKLELTESSMLVDIEDSVRKMKALKALGVGFSMDDFGTGYSSLSYLRRLPLDQLKIDQSFVRDMVEDESDEAIVRSIIAMGQALGLAVIAEGVETQAQRELLCQHGCHLFQGYLYSRPLPIDEFERLPGFPEAPAAPAEDWPPGALAESA
ncbi:MAG: EAL domain-containing protein [Halothiobacillaceae bacterium]|nr:EAL domain-containing protein [Halothiobacillaceae bacterium]